jgi:hypothetical protein
VRLAAHQPHFLPWLGYLAKVQQADVFVIVDHVQFERQNFQNRAQIATPNGVQWLSVPVHRGSRDDRLIDKRIDNKPDGRTTWGQRTFRTLAHAYGRTPHFHRYAPVLEELLTSRWERLVDLNLALLDFLLDQLQIATPLVRSSTLISVGGARSEMIVSVCRSLGADTYLSGSGGSRQYLDVGRFRRLGIEVEWQAFDHPRYRQVQTRAPFRARMSAVDLLFNCGPDSVELLSRAADRPAPALEAAS